MLSVPKLQQHKALRASMHMSVSVPLLVASSSKPSHGILPLSKINASSIGEQHKVIKCVRDVRVGLVYGQNNLTHMQGNASHRNPRVGSGTISLTSMVECTTGDAKLCMEQFSWNSTKGFPQQKNIFPSHSRCV